MKRFLLPLLIPCMMFGLLACGASQAAPSAAEKTEPPVLSDGRFYSPALESTDTAVTVLYQGYRMEIPLAENYMLHGKEGDEPRGAISQNSLFWIAVQDGKVSELTWLVSAQGWRSIVSDNYVVCELTKLSAGGRRISVINDKGKYVSGIVVPAELVPVDENGACDFEIGDTIRTATRQEDSQAAVVYVTNHGHLADKQGQLKKDPDLWDTLSEKQKAARTKVVDYMTSMAELEWTPSEAIRYDDFGGAGKEEIAAAGFTGIPYYAGYRTKYEFKPGTVYHGLPYTHQFGNYERMAKFIDDKGVLHVEQIPDDFGTKKDGQSLYDWNGWMGWDCYLGTDCSGSVYSAWSQISAVQFDSTGNELPNGNNGIYFVGTLEHNGLKAPQDIVAANDAQTMYECYAKTLPGDAMLYKGHTLLVASSATVYREADGTINPYLSYLLITDIQRTVYDSYTTEDGKTYSNTQWRVRRKVPFISLYTHTGGCVMLTNDALMTGNVEKGSIDLELYGFLSGVVRSVDGYRILSVTASIADGAEELWSVTEFCVGEDRGSQRYHRKVRTEYALSELLPLWEKSGIRLEKGKTYTMTVTAKLSTGAEKSETLAVKAAD